MEEYIKRAEKGKVETLRQLGSHVVYKVDGVEDKPYVAFALVGDVFVPLFYPGFVDTNNLYMTKLFKKMGPYREGMIAVNKELVQKGIPVIMLQADYGYMRGHVVPQGLILEKNPQGHAISRLELLKAYLKDLGQRAPSLPSIVEVNDEYDGRNTKYYGSLWGLAKLFELAMIKYPSVAEAKKTPARYNITVSEKFDEILKDKNKVGKLIEGTIDLGPYGKYVFTVEKRRGVKRTYFVYDYFYKEGTLRPSKDLTPEGLEAIRNIVSKEIPEALGFQPGSYGGWIAYELPWLSSDPNETREALGTLVEGQVAAIDDTLHTHAELLTKDLDVIRGDLAKVFGVKLRGDPWLDTIMLNQALARHLGLGGPEVLGDVLRMVSHYNGVSREELARRLREVEVHESGAQKTENELPAHPREEKRESGKDSKAIEDIEKRVEARAREASVRSMTLVELVSFDLPSENLGSRTLSTKQADQGRLEVVRLTGPYANRFRSLRSMFYDALEGTAIKTTAGWIIIDARGLDKLKSIIKNLNELAKQVAPLHRKIHVIPAMFPNAYLEAEANMYLNELRNREKEIIKKLAELEKEKEKAQGEERRKIQRKIYKRSSELRRLREIIDKVEEFVEQISQAPAKPPAPTKPEARPQPRPKPVARPAKPKPAPTRGRSSPLKELEDIAI